MHETPENGLAGLKHGKSDLLAGLVAASVAMPVTEDFQRRIGTVLGRINERALGSIDFQNNEVDLTSKSGQLDGSPHEGQLLIWPALGFQVNQSLCV